MSRIPPGWYVVELYGHGRVTGFMEHVPDSPFYQILVPGETSARFYGENAIYAFQEVTEQLARRASESGYNSDTAARRLAIAHVNEVIDATGRVALAYTKGHTTMKQVKASVLIGQLAELVSNWGDLPVIVGFTGGESDDDTELTEDLDVDYDEIEGYGKVFVITAAAEPDTPAAGTDAPTDDDSPF